MSNVFDISEMDFGDDDIESELEAYAAKEGEGSVFWPGDPAVPLFDYTIEPFGVRLEFTEAGQSLYGCPKSEIEDVQSLEFAHYLGVLAETRGDLAKRCGLDGERNVTFQDIVDLAKRDSTMQVTHSQASPPVANRTRDIPSNQVIQSDATIDDISRACKDNVVRHGLRQVASVYRYDNGTARPYMAKFVRDLSDAETRREEGRMMVFEHAALTAMRKFGLPAVESELHRDSDGSPYLLTSRFDRKPLPVTPGPNGGLSVDPNHKDQQRQFTPVAWNLTVARGEFSLYGPENTTKHLMAQAQRSGNERMEKSLLTTYLFNKVIGNTDAHSFNQGTIVRYEDGKFKKSLCPSFDITPHLLGQESKAIANSEFNGNRLRDLSLTDIAKFDSLVKDALQADPSGTQEAYQKAMDIRGYMERYISNDLVKEGKLSPAEAQSFTQYLNEIQTENTIPKVQMPFGDPSEDKSRARELFVERVQGMDHDQQRKPSGQGPGLN